MHRVLTIGIVLLCWKYSQVTCNICDKKPCGPGGTCTPLLTSPGYKCTCFSGFLSPNCADRNECSMASGICNNGKCVNTPGSYHCTCIKGFTGSHCNNVMEACGSSPCKHGGTCSVTSDVAHVCKCHLGFNQSTDCGDRNECNMVSGHNPCNNGTCVNNSGSFSCSCNAGYTGEVCLDDVDECLRYSCPEQTICVNTPGSYSCHCTPGYTGHDCQKDVDPCASNPCLYGSCVNTQGSFLCVCNNGWVGELCDDDVNECLSQPSVCVNEKCKNTPGSYSCKSDNNDHGNASQNNTNAGGSRPFGNDSCINTSDSYIYNCSSDYSVVHCERYINDCTDKACNGCVCINTYGSFHYDCHNEETNANASDSRPYGNDSCINTSDSYICNCFSGYSVVHCERYINECTDKACNGCVRINTYGSFNYNCHNEETNANASDTRPFGNDSCINTSDSYICNCFSGYSVVHCERYINECTDKPCNGCVCINTYGSFNYNCHNEETNANASDTRPFGNDSCINTSDSYICNCFSGYSVVHRERYIKECTDKPCNGCVCINTYGSFHYDCHNEETNANASDSRPFGNDSCINTSDSYICNCCSDYSFVHCERYINECTDKPCNGCVCINTNGSFHYDCHNEETGECCQTICIMPTKTSNSEQARSWVAGHAWVFGFVGAVVLLVPVTILAAVKIKRRRQAKAVYEQFGRLEFSSIPSVSSMFDSRMGPGNLLFMQDICEDIDEL